MPDECSLAKGERGRREHDFRSASPANYVSLYIPRRVHSLMYGYY